MTIREFLKETYKTSEYISMFSRTRPHIVCEDGFTISVQAGYGVYCTPRKKLEDGNYSTVELGFPSEEDELIMEYAESEDYTFTVYPYVPIEVVEQLIEKHGGIKDLRRN